MNEKNQFPLWDETSDLPACAEEGAEREVAFALDRKKSGGEGSRGRFLLLLVCLSLSLCVLFVAIVLSAEGNGSARVEPEIIEKEKVVFVREWDENSGILTTSELYEHGSEGVVTLTAYGTGTRRQGLGFFLSEDGYIATELSVVEGMDRVMAQLADGREYVAAIVGREPYAELCLLKIEVRGVQALSFGKSDALLIGERVVAVGSGSVCTGEVSGRDASIWIRDGEGTLTKKLSALRIGAVSLSDYAGAPILNEYGEVVGMISSRFSKSGTGYALPADGIVGLLDAMMSGEALGEELFSGLVTPASILGVVGGSASDGGVVGVRIHRFLSGLSSASAMLKEGDLIVSVDGVAVRSLEEISSVIEEKNPGETVYVTVLRFGQLLTFEVELSGRELG